MFSLTKTIHVLALGLWFGSATFFTFVAAPIIFHAFESLATGADPGRPTWLPALEKQQGTQLAGLAVGPIFPWFFLLEGVCGLLALVTCLSWMSSESGRAVHKLRFLVLLTAMLTVVVGWPLAQKVSDLRAARYVADSAIASAAAADFGRWHLYSLGLNFVTLLLVTVAMALAAQLPSGVVLPRQRTITEPQHGTPEPVRG
jgi:hypothetical protein